MIDTLVIAKTYQMYKFWYNHQETKPKSKYVSSSRDLYGRSNIKIIVLNEALEYGSDAYHQVHHLLTLGLATLEHVHV